MITERLSTSFDVAQRAAVLIADRMWAAVAQRGSATLAVSGGRTPAEMFRVLATLPVPWAHVHLFQVDERSAPDGHRERNATMLADELLTHLPAIPAGVHLMDVSQAGSTPAASRYAALLTRFAPDGLDLVHLGLGDDGHSASWPPGDPVIDSTTSVAWSAEYQGRARMTLTPLGLTSARDLVMTVTGASKDAALAALRSGQPPIPARRLDLSKLTLITDR